MTLAGQGPESHRPGGGRPQLWCVKAQFARPGWVGPRVSRRSLPRSQAWECFQTHSLHWPGGQSSVWRPFKFPALWLPGSHDKALGGEGREGTRVSQAHGWVGVGGKGPTEGSVQYLGSRMPPLWRKGLPNPWVGLPPLPLQRDTPRLCLGGQRGAGRVVMGRQVSHLGSERASSAWWQ